MKGVQASSHVNTYKKIVGQKKIIHICSASYTVNFEILVQLNKTGAIEWNAYYLFNF
jgi:hypothetical protein